MTPSERHNPRHSDHQQTRGVSAEFLTALRRGLPHHHGETEGVVVQVDGDDATLLLDDGEELTFSASELRGALGEAA